LDARAWLRTKSMDANLFWFNDKQWVKIVPYLPANQPGPEFATTKRRKGRNVVERCFCRLKDFRRIAPRYDKLAQTSFRPSASSLPWPTRSELIQSEP
jgi:hypothetical protein